MNAPIDVDRLTDQALALPPELRELVAFRIWESLHRGEGWEISGEQLDELRRRSAAIDAGEAPLTDGDDVLRAARARIEAKPR